jgi:hypothetical protein
LKFGIPVVPDVVFLCLRCLLGNSAYQFACACEIDAIDKLNLHQQQHEYVFKMCYLRYWGAKPQILAQTRCRTTEFGDQPLVLLHRCGDKISVISQEITQKKSHFNNIYLV